MPLHIPIFVQTSGIGSFKVSLNEMNRALLVSVLNVILLVVVTHAVEYEQ